MLLHNINVVLTKNHFLHAPQPNWGGVVTQCLRKPAGGWLGTGRPHTHIVEPATPGGSAMNIALSYLPRFHLFGGSSRKDASDDDDDSESSSVGATVSATRSPMSGAGVGLDDATDLDDEDDEDDESDEGADLSMSDDDDMSDVDGHSVQAHATSFSFAPASTQREFRKIFTGGEVPGPERVLKAYVCAIRKEILYHGKLYVTAHYVCFYSSLFNTQKVVIPFTDIVKIEPKMMMTFIPNAIAIRTRTSRLTFASFSNRNRTIDVLRQLRNSSPDPSLMATRDDQSASRELSRDLDSDADSVPDAAPGPGQGQGAGPPQAGAGSAATVSPAAVPQPSGPDPAPTARTRSNTDRSRSSNPTPPSPAPTDGAMPDDKKWPVANLGPEEHAKTSAPALNDGEKLITSETIAAPVGVVANIMFGEDTSWYRHFLVDVEKNRQLEKLPPFSELKQGGKRGFSYVKPLNGPVGPKQTKCEGTEQIENWDFDGYIEVITTTVTPDVPSGSSFSTLTRTVLTWADGNCTEIRLGTWLDWKAKSWLKGPIEKGAFDGQMSYGKALVAALSKKVGSSDQSEDSDSAAGGMKPAEAAAAAPKDRQVRHSSTAKRANAAIKEWQQLCTGLGLACALLLVIALYLYFRRPKIDPAPGLQRIQAELELWEWIDARRAAAVPRKQTVSDANLEAAIAATEKRLASLKAELIE